MEYQKIIEELEKEIGHQKNLVLEWKIKAIFCLVVFAATVCVLMN